MSYIVNAINFDCEDIDEIHNFGFETQEDAVAYAQLINGCYHMVSVNAVNYDPPMPVTYYHAALCFFDKERITYHDERRMPGFPIREIAEIRVDESGRILFSTLRAISLVSRMDALMRVATFWDNQDYKIEDFQYIGGQGRFYVLRSKIVEDYFYTRDNMRIHVYTGRWESRRACDKKGRQIVASGDPAYCQDLWFLDSGRVGGSG